MNIVCNGDRLEMAAEASLYEAVSNYLSTAETPALNGVAVACNGEVVPRHQWSQRSLSDGDRVDLFTAVAGG